MPGGRGSGSLRAALPVTISPSYLLHRAAGAAKAELRREEACRYSGS